MNLVISSAPPLKTAAVSGFSKTLSDETGGGVEKAISKSLIDAKTDNRIEPKIQYDRINLENFIN